MKSDDSAPVRYCFWCGEELGRYRDYDRLDTCGKQECLREARSQERECREEAHAKLDRDMGWGR